MTGEGRIHRFELLRFVSQGVTKKVTTPAAPTAGLVVMFYFRNAVYIW